MFIPPPGPRARVGGFESLPRLALRISERCYEDVSVFFFFLTRQSMNARICMAPPSWGGAADPLSATPLPAKFELVRPNIQESHSTSPRNWARAEPLSPFQLITLILRADAVLPSSPGSLVG